MNSSITIGELAKLIDMPTKTIRYYEEIGLIAPAKRMENGYRTYDTKIVEELKVIKYARDLDLPIEKIKKLMVGCKDGDCAHSKEFILSEITEYLAILDEKIVHMSQLKNKLATMKKIYMEHNANCADKTKFCCNIFHQLLTMKGGE